MFGEYYPSVLQGLITWYTTKFKDPLVNQPPIWFQTFIYMECFFQLPIFFLAIYGLLKKYNWIRIPLIIYGTHVFTTVAPIMTELATVNTLLAKEKLILLGIYFPYIFIPFLLVVYMVAIPKPFGDNNTMDDKKAL